MKKTFRNILCAAIVFAAAGCAPKALTEETLFYSADDASVAELTKDGKLYTIEEFEKKFMTEKGNYNLPELYRTRGKVDNNTYLFSLDTIPSAGEGVYLKGRISTDDYGGNYYKALVIQQVYVNGTDTTQQSLRISVDMGSVGGLYQIGQEILIRCNGLCIGRYSNQPQLCIPSYNNNTNAGKATEKIGWNPGRIPMATFNNVTKKLGLPDQKKLWYETLTMEELDSRYLSKYDDLKACRAYDGRLLRITNVHFTGQYHNQGNFPTCTQYTPGVATTGDPELDANTNVFAPTTNAQGYPQSRFVADSTNTYNVLIGCSEYAKYARYYLPARISEDFRTFDYAAVSGSISGILGFYIDKASDWTSYPAQRKYKFSITPRDLDDFDLYYDGNKSTPWVAKEWAKSNYK